MKKRVITIIIVLATVVLAGVAVYTAIRLYQLRQQAVAPTAPTSKPAAAEPQTNSCTQLAFTLTTVTSPPPISPSPSPSITPTPSSTPTPTPSASVTPTPSSTNTAQASSEPSLPSTGVSNPTLIGAGFGILAIIVSLMLAL